MTALMFGVIMLGLAILIAILGVLVFAMFSGRIYDWMRKMTR